MGYVEVATVVVVVGATVVVVVGAIVVVGALVVGVTSVVVVGGAAVVGDTDDDVGATSEEATTEAVVVVVTDATVVVGALVVEVTSVVEVVEIVVFFGECGPARNFSVAEYFEDVRIAPSAVILEVNIVPETNSPVEA